MRRAVPLFVALLLALAAGPAAARSATAGASSAAVPAPEDVAQQRAPLSAAGRFIVLLKDGRSVDTAESRARGLGVHTDRTFRTAVHGYSARLGADQVATLRADPDVEAVVPDEVISIAGQSTPTGVRRINGKQSLIAGIDGTDQRVDADVAIVDTGVGGSTSKSHEDLNIVGGHSCSTSNPNSWGDPNGHGTHVAGIVGALDNGIGVVGVAPGVRLWSVRILDSSGNGLISWYVCGLDWIASQRDPNNPSRPLFEAVNMSVAKAGRDDGNCGLTNADAMHRAICRVVAAGITVVAAAGNNSASASRLKPASYNEVITVSALADTDGKAGGLGGHACFSWGGYDHDDTFADFSNSGTDVDLIAPGKCIFSTLPGNRYGTISGTSMAAPHVTGAVALYKASRPLATPAQVKSALRAAGTLDWNTATDPDPYHEPLLDVSHIVALGDWTIDATPGTSHGALVGAAGGTVHLPLSLIRAEDFPGAVTLSAGVAAPLGASTGAATLTGMDQVSTTLDVTVPAAAPSGTYTVTVTASDGTRQRVSTIPVTVDSVAPSTTRPGLALRAGSILGTSVGGRATWTAATDSGSGVGGYELRWTVDGSLGAVRAVSSTTRSATRSMVIGHTYTLRLRARDKVGNWSAWVETAAFHPIVSQDTSPSLQRAGHWRRETGSYLSAGTALYAKARGAWVRRVFTGRAIAWVASEGRTRGKARVYVDGTLAATVDLYRRTSAHRVIEFTRTWSTSGSHTLKIVVLGTSGRPYVDVDAFVIVR
jgi:subtilisin